MSDAAGASHAQGLVFLSNHPKFAGRSRRSSELWPPNEHGVPLFFPERPGEQDQHWNDL